MWMCYIDGQNNKYLIELRMLFYLVAEVLQQDTTTYKNTHDTK
jgi:hypothetical protein